VPERFPRNCDFGNAHIDLAKTNLDLAKTNRRNARPGPTHAAHRVKA
jgi:hypothetical protein